MTRTVKVGDVYEMTTTEANGIKLKTGDSSIDNYFIILGFDSNGIAFGGVIINSQINENFPAHLKMYHIPIKQDFILRRLQGKLRLRNRWQCTSATTLSLLSHRRRERNHQL